MDYPYPYPTPAQSQSPRQFPERETQISDSPEAKEANEGTG